jgi:hypothetical protein
LVECGALVAAIFIWLSAALAWAGYFCGQGALRVLAIVVDVSVAFLMFALPNVELKRMI